MKMTAILVSGARGKTGRQLCAALLRHKGVEVLGATRSLAGPSIPGVTLRHFDWQNPETSPKALAGIEGFYLLRPKTADPARTIASLLRSAPNLKRVVLLSEIDAEHRSEETEERKAETVIKSSALDWTILRPNWFMQNFTEPSFYLEAIRDANELKVPTGGQPTSFVDTRDIADMATAALLDHAHSGRCYTLTGPQALTWADVAEMIGNTAGHPVRYIDPPLDDHLAALASNGTPKATISYLGRIYGCIRNGGTAIISGDIQRVTGHPPRRFSDFVEENKKLWRRAG
jgi:uncharacterized protein YbjT (DUF2867 family)